MEHTKILSRAWSISQRHKALWVFGFLFILAGGGGWKGGGGSGTGWKSDGSMLPQVPNFNVILTIAAIAVAILLVLSLLLALIRYVAETALIAGVNEIERGEIHLTIRKGFHLGWSRRAWHMLLADLLIHLPSVLLFLLALILIAGWLIGSTQGATSTGLIIIVTMAIGLPILLLFLISLLAISLFRPYIQRYVVLDQQGPISAIRQGIRLVRDTWLDTFVMWLLLASISIVWGLASLIVGILLAALVGVIALAPAGITYLMSQSWTPTVLIGGLMFMAIFLPLMAFIHGLLEVYTSSAWTLAYRQVIHRDTKHSGPEIEPAS